MRKAGRDMSVRYVGEMKEVRPFARIMAATLKAGLSHLRIKLRGEACRGDGTYTGGGEGER